MQPRQRRRRQARALPPAGVNRLSFGVQSMAPHVLAALGRTHDPANVDTRDRARARCRLRTHQRRPHLRHAGRDASTTGARRSRARSRSSVAHVERVRVDGRAARRRSASGRGGPRPRTRRRRAGRPLPDSPTTCSARPGSSGTRCRTGRGPARSAATTSCTGARANTSAIGARRTVTPPTERTGRRWWNVRTPDRYIAAVEAGQPTEAGSRDARPRRRGPRRRAPSRSAPAGARRSRRGRRGRRRRARGGWVRRAARRPGAC